ncbi:hypothetical protein NFI96_025055 [Prochilodus magdalenae]|nr:hypothetical protein NFI96_025055 [Prochilodus magdalenae]
MGVCRWCSTSGEDSETLQLYCTGGLTSQEIKDANTDLYWCSECVSEYHRARDGAPKLHKRLWELETTRLLQVFQEVLQMIVEQEEEDVDLYVVDDGQEQPVFKHYPGEFQERLRHPLAEVLRYPYLLCHQELCETVVKVLCKMDEKKDPLQVSEKYQGIYLLMVHPNETVRRWAISTARSLGRVDRDSFYELQEVFSCMFYVIELGISLDFPDNNLYISGKMQWMPSHLYDSKNEKNYWLGICMLLMQLDSQAMDSLFMGPEKQGSIPQCIINTMAESRRAGNMDSDPFWPALHCFMVILDRLGSKIWCQIEPADAFATITQAASYKAEVKNIRQKTGMRVKVEPEHDDDMTSCSQMVYDYYPTERVNRSSDWSSSSGENNINEIFEEMGCLVNVLQSEMGQGMRVYGSTFLWFIPFVRSVMELGELGIGYVDEVIHYLHNELNKDVLSGHALTCDKVTEFFIRILVDIIELLFSKGCMRTLHNCSSTWVKVIVQCSCSNGIPDRRDGPYRVPFPSVGFVRGNRILATGVDAMSLACMKLIRSLLKEGERVGKVSESADFRDLLNRHLREIPPRVWHLSQPESENLQRCLIKLVKAIMDRTVPSAPPTPPAEPPEHVAPHPSTSSTDSVQQPQYKDAAAGPSTPVNAVKSIKEEPLWHYEKGQDDFCDNLDEIVRAKKEPHSPVRISEFQPALDLNTMKPDLGKFEEIKSRLNNNQNLSKMQAIAKRGPNETERKQNGYRPLKEEVDAPYVSTSDTISPPSDSAKGSKPSKKKWDDDDDDNNDEELLGSSKSKAGANKTRQASLQSRSDLISDLITISDDDEVCSAGSAANRVANDASSDSDLNKSPSRDYDGDLSESQVFEFETQDYIASAWGDSDVYDSGTTRKPKRDAKSEVSHTEPMTCWLDTQLVSDEDIEKACEQAEEQAVKEQAVKEQAVKEQAVKEQAVKEQAVKEQHLHDMAGSSLPVPLKPSSSTEKWDNFIQPKSVPRSPVKKPSVPGKGQPSSGKKPVLIEPLGQKIKKRRASHNVTSEEPPPSSGPSTTNPSATPAIVPPKKFRKAIEPESVAERMGLKKKERKAFDLSQRSLDTLGELRSYGQNVSVEPPQKMKRVRRKNKPQPKLPGKGGKKLLPSQEMQYFRQSRGMLQKASAPSALPKPIKNPVPETLPKPTCSAEDVSKPEDDDDDEEDDYQSFLPCSQPDPARRTDQTVKQAKAAVSESSRPASISAEVKCKEPGFHQDDKGAHGNASSTPEQAKMEEGRGCGDDDDEWWLLTQNEPTDMELCSQMDQMDGFGENTQYEPVDMDIDADSQLEKPVNGTEVQPKPLSAPVSQKAPCAVAPQSSDGHLFLKPGMSPLSQRKAKPSTTKIYGTNSRSASLVVEMEKPVKPPPAANIVKAKVARPSTATLPGPAPLRAAPKVVPQPEFRQPEFRQPLPRAPHPPNQAPRPVLSYNAASHPPPSKTYPRPEDPVPGPRPTVNQPRRYDQSFLTQAILKWEFRMFENYTTFGPPDDLCPLPLREVPTRFASYEEYFNIMYPLLLVNAFEEMASESLRSGRINLDLKIQQLEYCNRVATASFTASLSSEQEMRQLYPKEDDLVLLWLPENIGAYANDESDFHELRAHFGYVSRSNVISNGGGQPSTLNLAIQTRGNVSSVDAQSVHCEVIGSLITTMREFRALCLLQNGIMARRHILLFPHISVFTPCQDGLPDLDMPDYNMDQVKAIGCGVAMVKGQQRAPKILLIHGPPGTGKSKTIVGLLERLLSEQGENASANRQSKPRRMRVLLCAPSNAAIDNLMKKVIPVFKAKCRNLHAPQVSLRMARFVILRLFLPIGNCGDINLVRLGSEKAISKDLAAFSLDRQIAKKTKVHADSSVQRQKEKLDQVIENLSQQCAKIQKQSPEFKQLMDKKQHFLSEREKLSRQLKEFRSKKQEFQAGLLRDAHVICCTLSSSGGGVLESAFRRLGHEPFSCVIVDEVCSACYTMLYAGQAKETETLIPLLHRCPYLILVGDPEQLPPTVVSLKAKDLGYDQSLMARLWKSLHQTNPGTSPSIFLSVQYRMHPNICEFPSKYIYNKHLKNDCETAQKRCSFNWPFEPYRVFDVTDGRESKEKDSFSNLKEVKLVVMLLKLIGEKLMGRVGVITPYNAQKQRILEAVRKESVGDSKFPPVDVDTVDGFQGREMDCVIVSCVRASSEKGNIGFVGNRQRMNVTITRAKFSLFILGHLRTLREHSDWGALIKDAANRGTIIKTQERDFREATTKVLKPDHLSRSLPHPPTARRFSNPTSPPQTTYIPKETTVAPVPALHRQLDSTRNHPPTGNHSPTISPSTSSLQTRPDWPRDPRLAARLMEPVREHLQNRERRASGDSWQHPSAGHMHRDYQRRTSESHPGPGSSRVSRSPERRGRKPYRSSSLSSSPNRRYKR